MLSPLMPPSALPYTFFLQCLMGTTNFIFFNRRFMQKTMLSRYAAFRSAQPTTAQVRLFELLGKAFLQQMRLLPWSHLSKRDRKRIAAVLRLLESDLELAQRATLTQPFLSASYPSPALRG